MFKPNEAQSTIISANAAETEVPAQPTEAHSLPVTASTARESTKDAGRVHVGGGMMRF